MARHVERAPGVGAVAVDSPARGHHPEPPAQADIEGVGVGGVRVRRGTQVGQVLRNAHADTQLDRGQKLPRPPVAVDQPAAGAQHEEAVRVVLEEHGQRGGEHAEQALPVHSEGEDRSGDGEDEQGRAGVDSRAEHEGPVADECEAAGSHQHDRLPSHGRPTDPPRGLDHQGPSRQDERVVGDRHHPPQRAVLVPAAEHGRQEPAVQGIAHHDEPHRAGPQHGCPHPEPPTQALPRLQLLRPANGQSPPAGRQEYHSCVEQGETGLLVGHVVGIARDQLAEAAQRHRDDQPDERADHPRVGQPRQGRENQSDTETDQSRAQALPEIHGSSASSTPQHLDPPPSIPERARRVASNCLRRRAGSVWEPRS